MKIGIDLRFLGSDHYSNFVKSLVMKLTSIDKLNSYTLYLDEQNQIPPHSQIKIRYTHIKPGSLHEQTRFGKVLKKDDQHLMIFFDFWKPISYKKEYFVFIPSLKNMFYQSFESSIEKFKYLTMIDHAIKHANKILVLDTISKEELGERFNIAENKIFTIPGAFAPQKILDDVELDLGITWGIKNPYFIYPGGGGIEKNLERLGDMMGKFKSAEKNIDLVILGEHASGNIALRDKIIEHNLQENVFFVGSVEPRQRHLLYKQSIGVVYPSLYETFSFDLTDPLHLNTPIISSNLPSIKRVFGESISYFSPISLSDMYKKTLELTERKPDPNYSSILGKYSIEASAKDLLDIIKL